LEEEEDLPKEEEDQQENEEEKPQPPSPPRWQPRKRKPKTTRRGQNTPIEPPVGGYGGGPSDLSLLPEYGKHIGSRFVDRRSKFDLIKNFRLLKVKMKILIQQKCVKIHC
jgi:hypothetical protein